MSSHTGEMELPHSDLNAGIVLDWNTLHLLLDICSLLLPAQFFTRAQWDWHGNLSDMVISKHY